MSGTGIRTAARTLVEVGDGSGFATAGHIAALIALARRRLQLLCAVLRDGTSCRLSTPSGLNESQ